MEQMDRIFIKDLLVRGIVGIKPDERANRQDILVLWGGEKKERALGL